jgi:hypothetical protein
MNTRFYDTDVTDAAWAWGWPGSAGGATSRATAHHQPSCCPQRHLLPPANRLSVATVTTRISALWHGLPLLSSLAKLRCVGPSTSGALRAGPSSCRTRSLSFGGDHGWPIGQDDRAWWCSWFRRTQAGQGTQTAHPGRHPWATGCQSCRAG